MASLSAVVLALLLGLARLSHPGAADPGPSLPPGVWPLEPAPHVERGFAPPSTPWGSGHRGADLRGHPAQPVLAAAAGRVAFASRLAGRGVVVVDHGAVRTTYEPVRAALPVGSRVAAGRVIGHLEAGGSHCFPAACLHWGLLRDETYLDPLLLVGWGPVRLLPFLSGAWMRLLVGPPQPVGADVGVDLGGRQ